MDSSKLKISESAIDHDFIETMKKDPEKWHKFTQKGRALVKLTKIIKTIDSAPV